MASALGVNKLMKIVALLQTGNTAVDKTLSYINLPVAQQLQKQSPSYITDIYVNIKDFEKAKAYISKYKHFLKELDLHWEFELPLNLRALSLKNLNFQKHQSDHRCRK